MSAKIIKTIPAKIYVTEEKGGTHYYVKANLSGVGPEIVGFTEGQFRGSEAGNRGEEFLSLTLGKKRSSVWD